MFLILATCRWNMEKSYRPMTAYGRSKLANILFTRELAHRLAGSGVTANCLHPGFVASRFGQSEGGVFAAMVRLSMVFASKPERGAKTIVHLAASPDVAAVTGGYFIDCRQAVPSREAQDEVAARRLWEESLRLAGL
jgi:retinol dehydrogenase-12